MPDMRELLETAYAGEPPMRHSTDDFVAGGRTRRARRRAAWAAGAAGTILAVAAVAVVPQIVAGHGEVPASAQDAIRYPVTAFGYTLTGYTIGGIAVSDPVNVTPGYQQARIRRGDEATRLDRGDGTSEKVEVSSSVLTVYRYGVFDSAAVGGGEPVQVGGTTGRYVPDTMLAWQYGPDAWAVIRSAPGHLSLNDMVHVAAAMRIGPSRPATLPWRMTYLPAGYQLSSMGLVADDSVSGAHVQRGAARFTRQPERYSGLSGPLTGADADSLRIKVFPLWYGESQLPPLLRRTSAQPSAGPSYEPSLDPSRWPSYDPSAGSSVWPTSDPSAYPSPVDPFCVPGQSRCFRYTADGAYLIEATATAPEQNGELIQVLRGTRLADPDDPTTWSELGEALPRPAR
ncbi:hypothetical protein Acy02nite_72790 [Actinoplanes cyaneus]|uniref:Uncharacterized protein n=1 Tax=Actinoplanes cyaneus TaxID=52696 RepID=A0A919M9F5_9ACTN|nr:hypothetical protein [Actinoplanes cyaneus]MCW2135602.1 hypothetical protein [Actinoplanes cyaneus]GID69398.1 hypothetical protein Acy02nite_72790 [Actinoplanes cyaneus]